MSKDKDKQYCVIDHANKQRDRERRYPARRMSPLKRPDPGRTGDSRPTGAAVGAVISDDD